MNLIMPAVPDKLGGGIVCRLFESCGGIER